MTEGEKKKIEEAVSIILRGIDIESSALILEKAVMDNYIIFLDTNFSFSFYINIPTHIYSSTFST